VEDAMAQNSRPKLEEYPDYLFVVIIGVRLHDATADPYDLATYDLCFFLGSTFLVTVHEGPSGPVEEVAKRLEKNPDVLARGVDRLAHETYRELLSSVLDSYLTQVSNRLGRVTKGLSVIATLSIPFVVLSGMWGMNMEHIPLAAYPHAFWWMFGIQLAVGVMLLFILRLWKLL
jgi:Mg2+ and Co2+ transporter CorA